MIIFVDPGASGCIGVYFKGGEVVVNKMPDTDGDIKELISFYVSAAIVQEDNFERRAVIEKVGGFAGEGQPGSAMFKFGDGYGFVRGILVAKDFRIEQPTPQAWQKILGLGHKEHVRIPASCSPEQRKQLQAQNARFKTEWKNKLKERAQHLYPTIKVTLAVSDALLILEAAKKVTF